MPLNGRCPGIHHVALRVFDLDEAAERWSRQFGFTVRERHDDRVLLACAFEDYSLELLASGERPGFDHAGWELAPGETWGDRDGEVEERPGGRARSTSRSRPARGSSSSRGGSATTRSPTWRGCRPTCRRSIRASSAT